MFKGSFYHGTIKNTIVAFGTLFSNIKITRHDNDNVAQQTLAVPIAYSPKEKWLSKIEQDPSHEKLTLTSFPRIGYEIMGYVYDPSRKLAKINKIVCDNGVSGRHEVFTPVPYNILLNLYFISKTTEDNLQILEQILPTFSPEYTLSVQTIPMLDLYQDVPIILDRVSFSDDYASNDFSTRRSVIHELSFTAKVNLYGPVNQVGVITNVTVNIEEF